MISKCTLSAVKSGDRVANPFRNAPLAALVWLFFYGVAPAEDLLDGRIFDGMIGPIENPDLADSLHFSDGHFWSDICIRCGFMPGEYTAERTGDGVRFRGILVSDSRGQFEYEGLVSDGGEISVTIRWERKRWYWTSRREIAFRGADAEGEEPSTLSQIRRQMGEMDPGSNPLCARF